MWSILVQYRDLFLAGFLTTLSILGWVMLIGIPIGTILGVVGGRHSRDVGAFIKGFRFTMTVIPVLVLLFWVHYPMQSLLGIVVDPFWTTVGVLSLLNIIGTASVVCLELELLPKTFKEAGLTLGLTNVQTITHIELPLLVRRAVPQVLLAQGALLEYTMFASLISVPEIFRTAQSVNSMVYKPVEIYSLLVLFFLMILIPLHLLVRWMQARYSSTYA